LVIEDGPTLTHGEMRYGAGVVAARQSGAASIVDPRQWAVGTMKDVYAKYDVGPVLPAMGYSADQLKEFEQMINAADVDAVLIATPIDIRKLVHIEKPAYRVFYELGRRRARRPSPTCSDPSSTEPEGTNGEPTGSGLGVVRSS